ncbi:MAG: hypothetical protein ABII82_04960, partial [Verrucomicrobiota bacterium]
GALVLEQVMRAFMVACARFDRYCMRMTPVNGTRAGGVLRLRSVRIVGGGSTIPCGDSLSDGEIILNHYALELARACVRGESPIPEIASYVEAMLKCELLYAGTELDFPFVRPIEISDVPWKRGLIRCFNGMMGGLG